MDAKEESLFIPILIVALLVGIIIIFFIASIVRQHKRNLMLYRKIVLAEITAMEKERTRIAADLHDELGPILSGIKLKINSFDLADVDDKHEVEKTNQHIDVLIQRMREISYDLIPNSLIRKGLVQALTEFTKFINETRQLEITFQADGPICISEHKAIHIYRIIQEIVHNTIKHSGANCLHIHLKQAAENLELSTRDNGVGFDHPTATKGEGGIGLRNIASRSEIIGGEMSIETKKDQGTKYDFKIPI
ncbi:MAG TPA: ATP-binding protein [Chitinophagaceae bacterium]|nr:ATP-binding protein [Chitinophagaceae bacterium]